MKTQSKRKQTRRSEGEVGPIERFQAKHAAVGALAIGAQAVGALSLGALAVGALAIGRFMIRRLAVDKARIRSLTMDELDVKRLHVGELVISDRLVTPSSKPLEPLHL